MKKGTLRFIGLAMGLCLVVPLSACNKQADTTQYKISITNKSELQGTWVVSQGARKVNVAIEPEANITELVNSGEITFASSNTAIVQMINQMAKPVAPGTAKITATYKGVSDEVEVTIGDKLPEPAHITGKTIANILAETPEANLAIYEVVGYVTGWQSGKEDATKYGNFYLGDTAETSTADSALVYGSSATATFTWSGSEYSYDYSNQDFLTHDLTKTMKIGSKVTAEFLVYYYGTTLELGGKIVNVEAGANVPATAAVVNYNGKAATALNGYVNENIYLTSKLTPDNSTDEVVWSVEDQTVATVSKGYVKPLKAGETKIIATANETVKAEVTLTVAAAREVTHAGTEADPYTPLEAAIKSAALDNRATGEADVWVKGVAISSSYYEKGNSHNIWLADEQDNSVFEIYGGLLPEGFDVISAENVVKSNAFKGYEVLAKGRLCAYNNTMELSSYKNADNQSVYPSILTVVKATGTATGAKVPATLELEVQEVAQLECTFVPFYTTGTLTYESEDETVATVAEDGKVTGVAVGTTNIKVYLGEVLQGSCAVTVKEVTPDETAVSFELTAANLLGYAGTNVPYAAGVKNIYVSGYKFASDGCGAYGDGLQMRTNGTTGTSKVFNVTAMSRDIENIVLTWNSTKSIPADKANLLYVEFSNVADFSELVGEKISVGTAAFTEKVATVTPTAGAKYFRISHGNQGAVYLASIVVSVPAAAAQA